MVHEAEKQNTIHEAPVRLLIALAAIQRFSRRFARDVSNEGRVDDWSFSKTPYTRD